MAYGDNSQYGNFSFQSDPNFLSNIMAMAQARKQKQQQQQQQMVQSALQLANKEGWMKSGQAAAPEGMSANQATLMSAANAAPGDAQRLRIMAYGPSQGEYTHDTMYGPLGRLQQGDVAISPNLASRFPLRSQIQIGTNPDGTPRFYRVADWSYYHPGEPTSNTVEIWNGQDMGYQPVQSFARGGVASWTDPYGNEPLAAQQYVHSVPMADVSGIAAAIMRQNQQKQEMYQQNIQNAMNAANKIMQERQTAEIGKAMIRNNPELSQDPRTWDMINAGVNPYQVAQVVGQQQADEADAKRQATNDYYQQQDRQSLAQYRAAQIKHLTEPQAGVGTPQTYTDEQGREWRLGSGGNWYPMDAKTYDAGIKRQYGITPGEFLDSTNTKRGNVVNGEFVPDENGTHIQITSGDKHVTMTVPEFEQNKQQILQGGRRSGVISPNIPSVAEPYPAPGQEGYTPTGVPSFSNGPANPPAAAATPVPEQSINPMPSAVPTPTPAPPARVVMASATPAPAATPELIPSVNRTPAPSQTPAQSVPRVGEVRKGYRFKGGNPADRNSWEKI